VNKVLPSERLKVHPVRLSTKIMSNSGASSSSNCESLLMTPEDVAVLLSVDRRNVLRWVREGKLDYVKLSPKHLRFTEAQVQEFIQSKTISKPKPVDNSKPRRLASHPRKKEGGEKSSGDSSRAIRKEIRSWQL
jgi:excisionase family DNA binding protein